MSASGGTKAIIAAFLANLGIVDPGMWHSPIEMPLARGACCDTCHVQGYYRVKNTLIDFLAQLVHHPAILFRCLFPR
ncbi:MAG TPA: hypothetical protein VL043_06995 [Protaetiibacter sp.]|nr:hypothetical protein [Protaetiibacter sp.]